VVLGGEAVSLRVAALLQEEGIAAVAIRPPTVPVGQCRLRLTLSALWSSGQVERLAASVLATVARARQEAAHD